MYTGGITFAAIRSQGVTPSNEEHRGDHSKDETKLPSDQGAPNIAPPGVVTIDPCSPKSAYCLASKVRPGFPMGIVVTNGFSFLGWIDRTL
jgi:hypothetical protein